MLVTIKLERFSPKPLAHESVLAIEGTELAAQEEIALAITRAAVAAD